MKIRELKITSKIADKHKKTMNALYIITYILLFPFVILDYLSDFLEWLCNKMSWFRTDIVYITFKIIYKKEIDSIKTDKEYKEENGWHGYYNKEIVELARISEHILSDYKRVLKENEELLEVKVSTSAHNRILELEKENEELTISNKEIDKECSRLEEKEVKLINENEHYKDLIYALKTYYDITEEDLEKCIKNDR